MRKADANYVDPDVSVSVSNQVRVVAIVDACRTSPTRAKVVRMTKRGEAVKTACVEVREELNRKVAGTLGKKEAARLEASLDAAAGLFGEIGEPPRK
jgi:hypothetical protein